MFWRAMVVLPWLLVLSFLTPSVIPESLSELKVGRWLELFLRWTTIAFVAFTTYRWKPKSASRSRKLAFAGVAVSGWVIAFFSLGLAPRTHLIGCAKGPLQAVETCHRWIAGFAPDIPYFGVAKGTQNFDFCQTFRPQGNWAERGSLTVHKEPHDFAAITCPPEVDGKCWATEWRTENGSDYFVAVATDSECKRGIYFDGRGQPARERWKRIRGFKT